MEFDESLKAPTVEILLQKMFKEQQKKFKQPLVNVFFVGVGGGTIFETAKLT